ncbi:arginine--tRNA ligase [Synechococcus sp. PCC 7336]|uniref:arginine--tRNA ligase n=1 Tax=Synechococcus sp. PCC 7336 TaxID=195250 RepID=UPI0004775B73|nr:arginine--tRNA ligase [Synechococcus sp. PCC 7336]
MATSTPIPDLLATELKAAIARASGAGKLGTLTEPEQIALVNVAVEVPNDTQYGDYASPCALGMAKLCRMAPRKIAEAIAAEISLQDIEVSLAGPGFINFRLGPVFLQNQLQQIFDLGNDYGKTASEQPEKILLEFVSANPTGPLHVGHGRWAAIGSTLANLLHWAGHQVDCEYYINDAGSQMQNLGRSLQVRLRQQRGEDVELPDDSYRGTYLIELAQKLEASGKTLETLEDYTDYAYAELLQWQRDTLHQLGTDFQQWFSERRLHALDGEGQSEIDRTLAQLQAKDYLYRAHAARQDEIVKEGAEEAVYFKTADFGDDKDRVIEKGDGQRTYLAADIAYHRDKLARGYDRLINILGADHHGYISRLKASVAAFGCSPDHLEVLLGQFVKLFRTNPETGEREEVKMSKRSGNFVTLNDLVEDEDIGVGVDATRWFLLSNSADSQINFDLDLAVKQTNDNPVFYVQYAHTRCCSLLRMAAEAGLEIPNPANILTREGELIFTEPEERTLLMSLLTLPEGLQRAADDRATHKVIRLTEAIATDFHKFYDRCRILGSVLAETPELAEARLAVVEATRQVLFNLLEGILAISAPTSM